MTHILIPAIMLNMEQIQYLIPLDGFEKSEVVKPRLPEKPPFKYLEIEVTRTESSTVYLKVPQDFDRKSITRKSDILAKACKKTLSDYDWDHYGWEQDIECQSVKEVSENDATAYNVYEVK